MVVSFTISLPLKSVLDDQFPTKVPSSCVTEISPLVSNAKILFALAVAPTANSVEVIVFVLDSFIERSTSS